MDSKKEWGSVAKTYSKPHIRKEYIRKPLIIAALGNVKGKRIIDLGCGDGYYSRILAKKGAKVVGVDFSKQSILLAKKMEKRTPLGIDYYQSDISNLSFLKKNNFDFAIADMVFVTVSNQKKYIKIAKEVYRVLKPNGEIIISKGHPANFNRKEKSKHYKLTYKKEPSYFDSLTPQKIVMNIDGKKATWTNYHRTLEDFLRPWLIFGFVITDIFEPKPSNEALKKFQEYLSFTDRIPHFILFKLKRIN